MVPVTTIHPRVATCHDVLIVGGGPAGAACAACCARAGLRVALLDRARFPRHKVCGDFLNPKCWDVFDRLGVAERVFALPHHDTPGFLFSTTDGRIVRVEFAAEVRARHRCVAVSRRLLDDCLLEQARQCGAEVHEGATVTGIRRTPAWSVEFQEHRATKRLAGRVLVGADGRHSFAGRQAGLLRREAGDDRVALQFLIRPGARFDDCIQLHQLPGGYCGAVKIADGLANVCMVMPKRAAARREFAFLRTNPVLADFLQDARLVEKPRSITPILGAEFRAAGRDVLLVGDAARVIEPFTGQGIYFALRSGELAAQAIAENALDGYEARLDAEYRSRTRTNRLMREVIRHDWAGRTAAHIVGLRPRWMQAIVASVIA